MRPSQKNTTRTYARTFRRCRSELCSIGSGLANEASSTGASKVMPVVHIARRQPWEKVAEAEKDMPDMSPVTAPAPNR